MCAGASRAEKGFSEEACGTYAESGLREVAGRTGEGPAEIAESGGTFGWARFAHTKIKNQKE